MNLAAKLWITNRSDCELLVQYVMQLARFDQSYDIRDRCRFLRNLLFTDNKLSASASEIFNTEKPSPASQSTFKGKSFGNNKELVTKGRHCLLISSSAVMRKLVEHPIYLRLNFHRFGGKIVIMGHAIRDF
ncbi:unnamed protein product [Gongylonema pulchrum]|uniref:Uncharacterized protein n=1 Tax=Gongylonema pulchrum TaxID=637853 RepID=A0A183DMM1_9BILA|nr:unnamed protein product [Gongylonema pulchrum]